MVRHIVRDGFRTMKQTRDGSHIAAMFRDDGVLAFSGDHMLGGERRGPAAVSAWFAQLFATFPDLAIDPLAVIVAGPPWATSVATRFSVTATLPDGARYANEGMQYLRLRFGRIVEDRLYEDTVKLVAALDIVRRRV